MNNDIKKIESELRDNSSLYMENGVYLSIKEIQDRLLVNPYIPNPVPREDITEGTEDAKFSEFIDSLPFDKQKAIIDFFVTSQLVTQGEADTFVEGVTSTVPDPNWQAEIVGKSVANNLDIRVVKKPDIEKALKNIKKG